MYTIPLLKVEMQLSFLETCRVSYRGGGGGGGGGAGISPPPPPEILKLSMVIILAIYVLLNISMCHQNVWKPRLRQKQSERYITSSKFSWGSMPPDPPRRHACVLHATIILLPSCSIATGYGDVGVSQRHNCFSLRLSHGGTGYRHQGCRSSCHCSSCLDCVACPRPLQVSF